METPIPGKISSSVETLGRGFVTIGAIIFLFGFTYGVIIIQLFDNMVSYDEWPFSFAYIPILVGGIMITVGGYLWYVRWKLDIEFQRWRNNQLRKQDIPIREIEGEKYRFDMEQGEIGNVD